MIALVPPVRNEIWTDVARHSRRRRRVAIEPIPAGARLKRRQPTPLALTFARRNGESDPTATSDAPFN